MSELITTAPRLQLRWARTDDEIEWLCHYELVLPLGEHDIRREDANGEKTTNELVLPISTTRSRGGTGKRIDAPFRDGAHARWDSQSLGGLPVFVIGSDGEARLQPNQPGPSS